MLNIQSFFTAFSLYKLVRVKYILLLLVGATLHSCDDFVAVELPDSQLTGEAVFEDTTTANAAMTAVYAKLRDSGLLTGHATGLSCRLGLYADELDSYQGVGTNNFYTNALFSSESGVQDLWNQSYNIIYGANAVLEGVTNSASLSKADKDRLKGEALFVRALSHFYLHNLYGDLPYVTTTDYAFNSRIHKSLSADLYNMMLDDANTALGLLPEEYSSPEKGRPNKAAVYALLSRIYLYNGQWAEATDNASAVLNNTMYVWETDLDKVFLKESTSTIWQFIPDSQGANTYEGSLFIFNEGPPPSIALTTSLVGAFEAGDQRKNHWIREITDGSNVWYHAFKYKSQVQATSTEYSIVFRLAEQYLIRSEARARQGDLIGAKEDLNKVRNRAGLGDTQAITSEEIVEAILRERRVELFTEFGHRFFDLKRLGTIDAVLSGVKPGWDTNDRLWPIPAKELSANPNLNPQNPGY